MKNKLLSTNRTLLRVTLLKPFRDLKIKCFTDSSNQTLEQFSSIKGYYLIKTPSNSLYPALSLEEELKKHYKKIFEQELSEVGIPRDHWPDINDFKEFNTYINVDFLSLIADFGEGSIKNIETILDD